MKLVLLPDGNTEAHLNERETRASAYFTDLLDNGVNIHKAAESTLLVFSPVSDLFLAWLLGEEREYAAVKVAK